MSNNIETNAQPTAAKKPKSSKPKAAKPANAEIERTPANAPEVAAAPLQVRPAIGASFKTPAGNPMTPLSVKVDGVYIPGVQHGSAPNVRQLLAFQGVLLGIVNLAPSLFFFAIVRLTHQMAGLNVKSDPAAPPEVLTFPPGAFVAIPHRDSSALRKFIPWSETDSAGNRHTRAYEIAFTPAFGEMPGLFFGAELTQTDAATLRLAPGGGALLAPGGLFPPSNAKEILELIDKLHEVDIAF